MKLTDFALIFIAIFLPVVIIVYVNTSFVVKAEKQEMYYKNIINSAVTDAVSSMKNIENEDVDIDYGYSGIVDKKISINAKTAISTFYSSLSNNFGIANNQTSINRLKMYIPVVAVLDYDGIYIHSAEEEESGDISFVTKPKVYYTYTYVLTKEMGDSAVNFEYEYDIMSVEDINSRLEDVPLLHNYIYEVNFTMDDYIYLNVYEINNKKVGNIVASKEFYLKDYANNSNLVQDENLLSYDKTKLMEKVIEYLDGVRLQHIAEIGMREISYAVNKHNFYAKDYGINYTFRFSVESDQVWYETMDGIGMVAIIQGISLGNRYLNYKAYSAADLTITKKYYVTKGVTIKDEEGKEINKAYLNRDLYHASNRCRAYLEYINSTNEKVVPSFYISKAEAATQGYYPCPVCKP